MRPVTVGLGGGEPRIRISPSQGGYGSSSPFLRGHAVKRSRKGLLRRRLKPVLLASVIILVPTVAVSWLMTSPRFAVRELSIVTGERVQEAWVQEALAPLVGQNLPRLPLARAEEILRSHPWVRGADLRKDLPARLSVRVAERRAVALLRATDGLHYLDSQGVRIAPFAPATARSVDLPLVSVTDRGRSTAPVTAEAPSGPAPASPEPGVRSAVQLLSEIEQAAPSWIAGLSEVEVLGEEDFCIYTSALPFSVLVTTGTLNQRVRRLEELMPQIVARSGAGAVDLRFARRIIVKPSVDHGDGPARSDRSRSGLTRPAPATAHQEATTNHAQRG